MAWIVEVVPSVIQRHWLSLSGFPAASKHTTRTQRNITQTESAFGPGKSKSSNPLTHTRIHTTRSHLDTAPLVLARSPGDGCCPRGCSALAAAAASAAARASRDTGGALTKCIRNEWSRCCQQPFTAHTNRDAGRHTVTTHRSNTAVAFNRNNSSDRHRSCTQPTQ